MGFLSQWWVKLRVVALIQRTKFKLLVKNPFMFSLLKSHRVFCCCLKIISTNWVSCTFCCNFYSNSCFCTLLEKITQNFSDQKFAKKSVIVTNSDLFNCLWNIVYSFELEQHFRMFSFTFLLCSTLKPNVVVLFSVTESGFYVWHFSFVIKRHCYSHFCFVFCKTH